MVTATLVTESPAVSVVTPTYNRRQRLERVLTALDAQDAAPGTFEVVVVDDGSTDDTASFLEQRRFRFELRHVRQANAGPARARNVGIENARGDLVLFLDDDVVPAPHLVSEHVRSHDDPKLAVIGPLASLPHYAQPWVAWEQDKLEQQYSAMARGEYEATFRQFWTGNASVRREHLLAAGGFDTEFLRAEDVELGLRLKKLGVKFRFNARALGHHHAERSLESWSRAQQSYGRLDVKIFERMGAHNEVEVLSDNWRNLHSITRGVVKSCLGHPLRHEAACRSIRALLEASQALPDRRFARHACSILANLIYWEASAKELGPARAAQVFG
jgi:glycosyltransferase involved in cell wall biosynthesis